MARQEDMDEEVKAGYAARQELLEQGLTEQDITDLWIAMSGVDPDDLPKHKAD